MLIAELIQLPKQSIEFLSHKINDMFPFLKPFKQSPMMTTDQYDAIYPHVAHMLYQELAFTSYDTTLVHLTEDDYSDFVTSDIELKGFYIIEHQTAKTHVFLLTYEGTWLYNNQVFKAPTHIQEFINRYVCNSQECLIYNKPLTKEIIEMENIERLQMEIGGIELPHEELLIYLEEESLEGEKPYNASSKANKKAIYTSALSVLNSIANQPHAMKNYKQDDMTVEGFAKYLQSRIDQLEKKIRQMPSEDSEPTNFFNLFK